MFALWMTVACTLSEKTPDGLAALGYDGNETEDVSMTEVGSSSDGLNVPRDLAFNPSVPGELWVVNRADDSVSIFFDAGTKDQESEHIVDPYAFHFMEEVSSISFGEAPNFGTCQESRNTYNGFDTDPNSMSYDFMGPTLWTSDLDVFGHTNDEAVEYLSELFGMHTDLGSHLDMLHESPLCMGIAWEKYNVYWVFDGSDNSIARYDFVHDHGPGFDDHSDGIISRYSPGEFKREPDVPSHMKFDVDSGLLYIADTGNGAIKTLDTYSGNTGSSLPVMEPGTIHYEVNGADIQTLIEGSEFGIQKPSGLAIIDDVLIITDNATGKIHAFSLDGALLDVYDTGLGEGALMGIYAAAIDDLWFVDAVENKLYRLQGAEADTKASATAGEYMPNE